MAVFIEVSLDYLLWGLSNFVFHCVIEGPISVAKQNRDFVTLSTCHCEILMTIFIVVSYGQRMRLVPRIIVFYIRE